MQVKIRLLGVLRETSGTKEVIIDVPDNSTVGSTIKQLIGEDEKIQASIWENPLNQ